MKEINTKDILDTAGAVGKMAQENGLSNTLAYILVAISLIMFVILFGVLFLLIREIITVKKKRTEELLDAVKDMKIEFTKSIKAFETNQLSILTVFGEHREHMEEKFELMKYEASESLNRLKDKINDGKDIDNKTFELLATSIMFNSIYNIERDMIKIIERNNLYAVKRTLLGNSQTTGEIENRVAARLDEGLNSIKNIAVNYKLLNELQARLAIEKEAIIKDLCSQLDVDKDLIVDERTKATLRRAVENDCFKHRNEIKKQIESCIIVAGGAV